MSSENGPQGCCAVPSTDQHGKGLPFAGRLYFFPFPWQRARGIRRPVSNLRGLWPGFFLQIPQKKPATPIFLLTGCPPCCIIIPNKKSRRTDVLRTLCPAWCTNTTPIRFPGADERIIPHFLPFHKYHFYIFCRNFRFFLSSQKTGRKGVKYLCGLFYDRGSQFCELSLLKENTASPWGC